jgi:hypothetical protein
MNTEILPFRRALHVLGRNVRRLQRAAIEIDLQFDSGIGAAHGVVVDDLQVELHVLDRDVFEQDADRRTVEPSSFRDLMVQLAAFPLMRLPSMMKPLP